MDKKEPDDRKRRIAATIAFFSEAIRFIVLPLLLLYIVISNFPILTPETAFRRMASTLIIFGGLIALSSSMEAYFPMGSKLKMIFGIISIATLCAWFWFLFSNKGIVVPFSSLVITLDLFGLLMVILFAISLKGLLPVGQYLMARDERRKKTESEESKRASRQPAPDPQAAYLGNEAVFEESEPPPPEDLIISCPVCRADLSPRDDVCPRCGVWIRQRL